MAVTNNTILVPDTSYAHQAHFMRRRVRELHFVDIVDVEQLLEAMGQDVAPIALRIQKLLLPSYFPGTVLACCSVHCMLLM